MVCKLLHIVVAACLVVSTGVYCFISATGRHFQLYIAQERLGFDLEINYSSVKDLQDRILFLGDAP